MVWFKNKIISEVFVMSKLNLTNRERKRLYNVVVLIVCIIAIILICGYCMITQM